MSTLVTCDYCDHPVRTYLEESEPPRCEAWGAECECNYVHGRLSERDAVIALQRKVQSEVELSVLGPTVADAEDRVPEWEAVG